ncbi:TPA: HAD hydrolase-like protein, partial [Staphylococcus pseudintermedius]|nr:HAD hydrolase-like protein [Staphylococcus pseudintermedius]
ECLFIGDSFKNDILGALNVNMSAIWLTDSAKESQARDHFYICKDNIEVLLKKLLDNYYQGLTINN